VTSAAFYHGTLANGGGDVSVVLTPHRGFVNGGKFTNISLGATFPPFLFVLRAIKFRAALFASCTRNPTIDLRHWHMEWVALG
jgi:hypothetical protein